MTTPSQGSEPQQRLPRSLILLLGVLAAFGPLATDMYLPALPRISGVFGVSASSAQLTLTISLVGLAFGQLFIGPFSDRLGRRRPLLVGVAAFAVFSAGCALAPNYGVLMACRLGQALGASAGVVLSRAICRDLSAGRALERLLSTLQVVSGVAPALAPIMGSLILRAGSWRLVFATLTGIGLLLFAAVAVVMPETRTPAVAGDSTRGRIAAQYLVLLRDRSVVIYVLIGGLCFTALFTYISNSTFVLQQRFGLSATEFSLDFGVNSLGLMLGARVRITQVQRKLAIGLGILILASAVILTALLLTSALGLLLIGFFLLTVGYGFVMPGASALALAEHPESAGAAAALLGGFQFVAGGLIAPLGGLSGARAMFGATLLTVTAAAALLAFAHGRSERKRVRVSVPALSTLAGGPGGSGAS